MMADPAVKADQALCFHCGEIVVSDFGFEINGQYQPLCCPGCRAVAELIADSGLAHLYQHRTSYSEKPGDNYGKDTNEFCVYDEPELAKTFCSTNSEGLLRASLLVGGVTCAACTWLIEHRLDTLDGVEDVQVNLASSRLDMTLDAGKTKLSSIFQTLAALGYKPLPFREDSRTALYREERHADLRRLGVAGLGMMQVGMFAIALHAGGLQGMEVQYEQLLRWVSLPIAAWVVFYSARPFFSTAWRHLRVGALVMDLPIALAIGLAFCASLWATLTASGHVYFDSVVMFTFFLLLGRFLEKSARWHSLKLNSNLESALPDHVLVFKDDQWQPIPRIQVAVGDRISVRTGELIPLDGNVLAGTSSVKEDTFSGESAPRPVGPGVAVYAGTLNLEGNIELQTTTVFARSRLASLQNMVSAPAAQKPDLVKFADAVSSVFIAVIIIAASATWCIWHFIAPDDAFWISLSVLVISCPCALALATPTALASASSRLRDSGVLVQGENALEGLLQCTHVVFDKTGTLTKGNLRIERVVLLGDLPESEVLGLCSALQQQSTHPISSAFSGYSPSTGFDQVEQHIGQGVEGTYYGTNWRMGNENFCRDIAPTLPTPPADNCIWIALCTEERALAWIGLMDEVRSEAAQVVKALQVKGLEVQILTGDTSPQGPAVAGSIGIKSIKTGQTPADKLQHIKHLQDNGANICMVGDGINDAAVLKRANVSFAVPGATDLSKAQADFVLVTGDLRQILSTWYSAQQCQRVVRENFAWALIYNLGAMPVAAAGLIAPWLAAIGMSLSSLLVVGNSMRLRLSRPQQASDKM
jgi:Cu2+-exporting ATPase